MALVGLGIVTVALFVGIFKAREEFQLTWLIRGYLLFVVYALGFRIEHITSTIDAVIGAINGTL